MKEQIGCWRLFKRKVGRYLQKARFLKNGPRVSRCPDRDRDRGRETGSGWGPGASGWSEVFGPEQTRRSGLSSPALPPDWMNKAADPPSFSFHPSVPSTCVRQTAPRCGVGITMTDPGGGGRAQGCRGWVSSRCSPPPLGCHSSVSPQILKLLPVDAGVGRGGRNAAPGPGGSAGRGINAMGTSRWREGRKVKETSGRRGKTGGEGEDNGNEGAGELLS